MTRENRHLKLVSPPSAEQDTEEAFYDLNTRGLIIGRLAYIDYVETAEEPRSVYPLTALLEDETIELPPHPPKYHHLERWDEETVLESGRIVIGSCLVNEHGIRIDRRRMDRARRLDLMPSRHMISKLFGTHSRLYERLGVAESRRLFSFAEWTTEDFVRDVQRASKQRFRREGKLRPTYDFMKERASRDMKKPNPETIKNQLGITYSQLLELAGFPDIKSWEEEDFLDWGIKFHEANGYHPSREELNFLSSIGRGPSSKTIQNHFGGEVKYRHEVIAALEKHEEEKATERLLQLAAMEADVAANIVPAELFEEGLIEDEMLRRYARFSVVNDLLPDLSSDVKLNIASGLSVKYKNLVSGIRSKNNSITAGDVEATALSLGLYDILFPLDTHLSRLKIKRLGSGRPGNFESGDGVRLPLAA